MQEKLFHPAVQNWFDSAFSAATPVQSAAWKSIAQGQHTLLAAPTGSGKTLAAFLAVIDGLLKLALQDSLMQATYIVYVSPLKALSNDIQLNLQQPLNGIRLELERLCLPEIDIQAGLRTGDSTVSERQKAIRKPPHILVTTPESLYVLLTSQSGRGMLATVTTVIIDEIHALAGNKRGAHLSLSLQRLQAVAGQAQMRIGLSATQKPIQDMADFLLGVRTEVCHIVDTGHVRKRDLQLLIPASPLQALMSNEVWQEIYDQLEGLINQHQSTLIFVNTRRLAERAARFLAERLGDEQVMSHHGSMSKEKRLLAEQRLKRGELRCLVATASLELGIDIGAVDLVCQLGSPRSIAVFLQRVGRSGHAVGGLPKGRLFPLSRDELLEMTALLHAAEQGMLDKIHIPLQPLDILAQQIVAETANRDWPIQELYELFQQAWCYRRLTRQQFDDVLQMLATGFATRRGRRSAHIHLDGVNGIIRGRQGARLTALTNGGAIPDQFDYDVILTPDGIKIGTLNEDFAFESLPGDIFQLGNSSYRILKTESNKVLVADAQGQPPNIPFWFGEAPGRTDELSAMVSQLRIDMQEQLQIGLPQAELWLQQHYGLAQAAAQQLADYLATARYALSALPSQQLIVLERFLDEVGDMHLVIHSSFGSRINRAWGLGLRKRFCCQFNFELQAAALEDTIILSLSATHSFPLDEVCAFLNSQTVKDIVIQALLDVPLFATHWRWNATFALAVKRFSNGRKSPPYFQRADAEDLVAVVFPDQLACLENIAGNREIPDHPLIQQTLHDCLYDVMDIDGLIRLLNKIENKQLRVLCKDLAAPSPLAQEVIHARPYAFLDEAPAEERRTRAISAPHFTTPEEALQLAAPDKQAIQKVSMEAWPLMRNDDELHEALMLLGCLSTLDVTPETGNKSVVTAQLPGLQRLSHNGRCVVLPVAQAVQLWVATERMQEFKFLYPVAAQAVSVKPVIAAHPVANAEAALIELLRSRLQCMGPLQAKDLARLLMLDEAQINQGLLALEQEGFVIRGHFSKSPEQQWCERHILARIHRNSIQQRRRQIAPVSATLYMRFLMHWHGLYDKRQGESALLDAIQQLQGRHVAAAAWESDILPVRIQHYTPDMLDKLCASGQLLWLRLQTPSANTDSKSASHKASPINLLPRQNLHFWQALIPTETNTVDTLSSKAQQVYALLQAQGASFFMELVQSGGLLKTYAEEGLAELANAGLVSSDHFAGLRAIITPQTRRPMTGLRHGRSQLLSGFDKAGRWGMLKAHNHVMDTEELLQFYAEVLLYRYGIVFRKLLQRESVTLPWRDLLQVFWRLEARGDIRGGRFVDGMDGEQFALPEAVQRLRELQKQTSEQQHIAISACDPLNLTGIVLPGDKVPALQTNRILLCAGKVVAVLKNKQVSFFEQLDGAEQWRAEQLLLRRIG